MDIKNDEGLTTLQVIYIAGSAIAALVFLWSPENRVRALLFLVWGGLILGSTTLALKKGRELIEGAILGAFGPLGFIIEVLLPPIPTAHPPTATRDPQGFPAPPRRGQQNDESVHP